jgi:putative acetyltransferase
MLVRLEFGGGVIARQILLALDSPARERGYSTLRLETGTRRPEVIRLYRSSAYGEVPCFGEYADNPFGVYFVKRFV